MVNEQLLEYIRLRQAAGASKDEITNALTSGGWAPMDVAEGFSRVNGTPLSGVNTSPTAVARKSYIWWVVGGIILLLLLAGGAVYEIPSLRALIPGMSKTPVAPLVVPTPAPTPVATSTLEVATSTPNMATSTLMATSTPSVATSTSTTTPTKK